MKSFFLLLLTAISLPNSAKADRLLTLGNPVGDKIIDCGVGAFFGAAAALMSRYSGARLPIMTAGCAGGVAVSIVNGAQAEPLSQEELRELEGSAPERR